MNMMGDCHRREKQTVAVDTALHMLRFAVSRKMDVVLDERNLYAPEWSLFYAEARKLGCKVEWKAILTSPEE